MLDRNLKHWELALMFGLLCGLLGGFWLDREQTQLADRVIRFHVIANSDSPEDQALKLQVRDRVLAETETFYPERATLEEARAALEAHLEELAAAGQFLKTNDGDQGRILQHGDEFIAKGRNDPLKGLGQDDKPHGLPPVHAQTAARFHLPSVNGFNASAENFRNIRPTVDGARKDRSKKGIHLMMDECRQGKVNKEDLHKKRRPA